MTQFCQKVQFKRQQWFLTIMYIFSLRNVEAKSLQAKTHSLREKAMEESQEYCCYNQFVVQAFSTDT